MGERQAALYGNVCASRQRDPARHPVILPQPIGLPGHPGECPAPGQEGARIGRSETWLTRELSRILTDKYQ